MRTKRLTRLTIAASIAAALVGLALTARAEHFDILLQVEGSGNKVQASMDTTPPIGGVNPRPVLKVKSGEQVRVAWTMKSAYPHGTMKAVTVHFFVVREDHIGQKPVPNPAGPAGVVDNSFVMDFSPTASANGALRFRAPEPGNYLVRVQSENTYQEHDHEHFSAVDLQVE